MPSKIFKHSHITKENLSKLLPLATIGKIPGRNNPTEREWGDNFPIMDVFVQIFKEKDYWEDMWSKEGTGKKKLIDKPSHTLLQGNQYNNQLRQ